MRLPRLLSGIYFKGMREKHAGQHCSKVNLLSASSRLTPKRTSNAQSENSDAVTPVEIQFLVGLTARPLLKFYSKPGAVGYMCYLSPEGTNQELDASLGYEILSLKKKPTTTTKK